MFAMEQPTGAEPASPGKPALASPGEPALASPGEPALDLELTAEEAGERILDSLIGYANDGLAALPRVGAALVVVLLTWLVAHLAVSGLRRVLGRSDLRTSLKDLIRQLLAFAIWVGGILLAAMIAFPGVTPGKLLTVLGLGSIAIGFAFKDIFENFFAGVLILWRFPFENGDFIEVGEACGRVESTTIRMTQIRQTDGQLVVVPNADILKSKVTILTSQPVRRVTVIAGVAYGEDVDAAREVIRGAVEGCETVAKGEPIQIFAQAFGSSSIDFEVTWWTGSRPLDIRRSRDEVVAAVKRSLDEAGIEIPFPYRTLTFKEPLPLRDERNERNERDRRNERDERDARNERDERDARNERDERDGGDDTASSP